MGERCGPVFDPLFSTAQDACRNNTCSQECVQALQAFNQTAGCCINTNFNSTGSTGHFLSYEFWSECGLQTPGECEVRLNGAVQPQAPGIAVVILLLMTLMLHM